MNLVKILVAVGLSSLASNAIAADAEVTVGWVPIVAPYITGICDGSFEKATGVKVNFQKFDSGAAILSALASGAVDFSSLGSPPAASAISKGLDVEVIWMAEYTVAGEALVGRSDRGIVGPQDLKGKKIATPFGSTSHYHLLVALKNFGISPSDVEILNMTPPQIVAAWKRGYIDASYVWDPILTNIIRDNGHQLVDSGQLAGWGEAIFDVLIANKVFASENGDFLTKYLKEMSRINGEYRQDPEKWASDKAHSDCLSNLVGVNPADIPAQLKNYTFLTAKEEISSDWLGGGEGGRVASWLGLTAKFLKDQGIVSAADVDFKKAVNDTYARAAAGE
ncbi:taurine ABC transporter substrate-binding protein [Shinella granuli]|uniref:Taurine transport system substrate-binding protein n=2 Tax=Shinella granuli TaxID=323621 RepID=A0A4R2C6E2_SHIGR|nr:taurine transport system substrate-binding protein [Shinella granuli]